MSTHEPELVAPIDLCTPDGSRLNPAARGWSRRPLHRANLDGCHGRNKRWDYWAVLAGDLVVSAVYSDVDHFGLADVWWADLTDRTTGGRGVLVADAEGMHLPERPGTEPLRLDHDDLTITITDDDHGTALAVHWTEPDGRPGRLHAFVDLPEGHESLNVVVPWSDEEFNFTSKHQARPARGTLTVGNRTWEFGAPSGAGAPTDHDAWGVLDVGRGRWPERITWNWGGGAGWCDDRVVGLQFGAKWTEGTGATENGVLVDGRLTKFGDELEWTYDWDRPLEPWRVRHPAGLLDVTLHPRYDKHTDLQGRRRSSEVHQVFGTWSGHLVTDAGERLDFVDLVGFAEEARQHW